MSDAIHLYKYHAVNRYTLSALARRQIWAAKPSSFNDPFDCRAAGLWMTFPVFGSTHVRYPGRRVVIQPSVSSGRALLDSPKAERINEMGVYCMAKEPTNRLMWSHYADQHRGFCIKYAFTVDQFASCIKVSYQRSIPDIDSTADFVKHAAQYKAKEWEYEDEYRIVFEKGDAYYNRPATLSAVVFGQRCAEFDRETICKIAGDGVAFHHVHFENDLTFAVRDGVGATLA